MNTSNNVNFNVFDLNPAYWGKISSNVARSGNSTLIRKEVDGLEFVVSVSSGARDFVTIKSCYVPAMFRYPREITSCTMIRIDDIQRIVDEIEKINGEIGKFIQKKLKERAGQVSPY
ncbi:MAG: hypothetical protein LBF42_01990 [Puniceicoccales bacterium]|jgi:hypothetical protein|nr:hypothetical protein [Puniceicoccales bacterium]